MKSGISILLVAEPGPLRNGLEALLRSIMPEHSIAAADDAVAMMNHVAVQQPEIVLLDFRLLGDEAWPLLRRMKQISPSTQRIVLADDVLQQQAIATPAAEEVLLKGVAAAELVKIIEKRLPGPAPAEQPPGES